MRVTKVTSRAVRPDCDVSARTAARRAAALALAWALVPFPLAHALMAGMPPDSPAARVDTGGARSPFAGVGSLTVTRAGGEGVFTATAIDARHVVTAAHVVGGAAPAQIAFNLSAGAPAPRRIPAEAVAVHPGFRGVRGDIAFDDLAVVRLAEPLPDEVPIYPLHRLPLAPGAVLVLAGFGASGSGDAGATVKADAAVRRVGVNAADEFLPGPAGRYAAYLFDFDGPGEDTNRLGGPGLGNHRETTVAGGDSGSPAFVRVGGRLRLAGVNTFQVNPRDGPRAPRFGSLGGGMLISAYADWIERVIAAAPGN